MNLGSLNFNCVSLNVRGLNQSNKRRNIFIWLHQQNAQIVFLQETFRKVSDNGGKNQTANIYAPNDNTNKVNFFKNLQERLRDFSDDNMIIAGDFNCPLTTLDENGEKQVGVKTSVINEIQKIMSLHGLSDVWRNLFPQQTSFTWRDEALKVRSRLDYFLVSKVFKSNIHKYDIFFAPLSDHSAMSCSIRSDNHQKKSEIQVSWNSTRLC